MKSRGRCEESKLIYFLSNDGEILRMSIPIEEIAQNLFNQSSKLPSEDIAKLRKIIALGNTLIDLWHHLLTRYASKDTSLLRPVIDEIFLDLHISVTLAMGGQYKAACVLLRTFVETVLYTLYFIDHPIEVRIWANTLKSDIADMKFRPILEKFSQEYMLAASGRNPDIGKLNQVKTNLFETYRILSEKAHGKYAYLQATNTENNDPLDSFVNLAHSSIDGLIILGTIRISDIEEVKKTIPALENYL